MSPSALRGLVSRCVDGFLSENGAGAQDWMSARFMTLWALPVRKPRRHAATGCSRRSSSRCSSIVVLEESADTFVTANATEWGTGMVRKRHIPNALMRALGVVQLDEVKPIVRRPRCSTRGTPGSRGRCLCTGRSLGLRARFFDAVFRVQLRRGSRKYHGGCSIAPHAAYCGKSSHRSSGARTCESCLIYSGAVQVKAVTPP